MPGQLPKERMPALWALTDVSLVLLRDQPLFRTVLPSKLFEALLGEVVGGRRGRGRTPNEPSPP